MDYFRIGELFCGAGGIGLGIKMANKEFGNIKHIWATDFDKDACKTFSNNIGCKVIIKDVRNLDFNTLEQVNALTFGFPCNDFSVIGEQNGIKGDFGSLYKYCVKAVDHFKPYWFLAENVTGLKSSDNGKDFLRIMNEFANLGYRLYPHTYKFHEYGVPQKRQRILIVGIRDDLPYSFKIPSNKEYIDKDVSVRTALSNIPSDAYNHEYTTQSDIVIKRLQYIKQGENAFTANIPKELQLKISGAKLSQIYRRLKENEPAYTITASGGGGTHVYHYSENRALTNRERARLQSFPDDFIFYGSKESVRKQIGMAVPPVAVKIIIEAILKTFSKITYDSIPCNIEFERQYEIV
ncbi:DNA cytosine methyltransferase [Brachyspira hyodysenteriae]|uniref:DNA cytosine methyltransferase n=2 Tax=Brachyspira hyodysenteriae TaxID=159 RepID=UPI0022CD34F0|nr:DNA cytosine methyltransferase [Brachyspira hyodysenteriae]MCZ9862159.1 DNA cytosine methyltransferase [Brachyspira hyodysenteriae]MCZ9871566.1 DNA cytosine methyltransferase [Brachyspira hyodysenteriae]MCZ9895318.1 DNA cytosine methyltransferase [Brachyspira hyodysenteriae]MCZ9901177.1 DNA cytosine methyltransferase [Brachyspira hyodysenteriae]